MKIATSTSGPKGAHTVIEATIYLATRGGHIATNKGTQSSCYGSSLLGKDLTESDDGEYILKVTVCGNTCDRSQRRNFIFETMQHIRRAGFLCPTPVAGQSNKLCFIEAMPFRKDDQASKECLIFMLTYLRGQTVYDVCTPFTPATLYELGVMLGDWRIAMSALPACDQAPDEFSSSFTWDLQNASMIRPLLPSLEDPAREGLVEDVLAVFERTVSPNLQYFEKGIIHGDFHDENVILMEGTCDVEHSINYQTVCDYKSKYGVIDFMDVGHSYWIFDLATSLSIFMISFSNGAEYVTPGAHFLLGYLKRCHLNDFEREALYVCVCMAYCRELVLCTHNFKTQEETNEYLLVSARSGWEQLSAIWRMGQKSFCELLNRVLKLHDVKL